MSWLSESNTNKEPENKGAVLEIKMKIRLKHKEGRTHHTSSSHVTSIQSTQTLGVISSLGWMLLLIISSVLFITNSYANSTDKKVSVKSDVDIIKLKQKAKYSRKGADTCLKCHDEDSEYPVMDIFKTPHGSRTDQRAPMANQQCETCHGPAGKHTKKRLRKGQVRAPMITFKKGNGIPVLERNKICRSCHDKIEVSHWEGSVHQENDVACSDCHTIHAVNDPVQKMINQAEVCGTCHQSEKLATKRFSTHPIRYDVQIGCTSCHKPHGSDTETLLVGDSINDTCFQCHAEKRGPFAWEHEPVTENCALCHSPHGTNHRSMLKQAAPTLCQNCHSAAGHPSVAQDDTGLTPPAATASQFLLGRSCTNCHSQVHGSNHPSGNRLQR